MNNPILFVAVGIFLVVGCLIAYVLFMIFLPEWVGITGKVAEEARKSHEGKLPADDTFDSNLQKWHDSPTGSNDDSNNGTNH